MRIVTYDLKKLPALKKRLVAVNQKFKDLGYGSKSRAALWLIDNKYQTGTLEQVAKKISHLLNGYVRGIHATLRSGGVWKPEEAERILKLLDGWLKTESLSFIKNSHKKLHRQPKPLIEQPPDEF